MIVDLTPHEVARRLTSDDPPLLIDVREDWEFATAAIDGSVHVPLATLPHRASELPTDRDLVFVCHHGARSRAAADWLAQRGHARLANLAGGIDAWSAQVDPRVPRYI